MIKIKRIEPPKVDLYAPDGTHLGLLNQYEFFDALVQIKEAQEFGYYAIFEGRKIRIDRNGTQEEYPNGMFTQFTDLLSKLVGF